MKTLRYTVSISIREIMLITQKDCVQSKKLLRKCQLNFTILFLKLTWHIIQRHAGRYRARVKEVSCVCHIISKLLT